MRNSLRLIALIGGASLFGGAAFLVACSSDTDVDSPGADGGGDTSRSETSTGTDSGVDSSFDAGLNVKTFDEQLGTELCKALAKCCYGNPTPPDGGADGGAFDQPQCFAFHKTFGFEGSNLDSELKGNGSVDLDQLAGDSCIKKIQAMDCNLAGPDFKAIRTACFGAYRGKLAAGATCSRSIECQIGNFCKGANLDGGVGTCSALRPLGGACGDFTDDPSFGGESCSYRRGGDTGRFCNFRTDAGAVAPAADWKCATARAAGQECATSVWCSDSTCQSPGVCATPDKYWDNVCTRFIVP